jgi:hypothetical protein
VKPYEASEAETGLLVSISEPIKVGHEVSKHAITSVAKMCLLIFIW